MDSARDRPTLNLNHGIVLAVMSATSPGSINKRNAILILILIVVAGIAIVIAILWPLTDVLARHDIQGIPVANRDNQVLTAVDSARGQIFQLCAGILAIAGFYFTARSFALSRQQSELNRQTLELSVQGQMTDRFSRAIDQIGSEQVEIRVGGIYSLERLAADSRRDQSAIIEMLCAFVRSHAQASRNANDRSVEADVSAAMTVIARRDEHLDCGQINLRHVGLFGFQRPGGFLADIDFSGAMLAGAQLSQVNLCRAVLAGADLSNADLRGAKLSAAQLTGARMSDVQLAQATMSQALLSGTDLDGANLVDADLSNADLTSATMRGCDLRGADLRGARLVKANLTGAKLPQALLERVHAPEAVLVNADLEGAHLANADLTGAHLADANLAGADCRNCHLAEANLYDTVFAGACLEGVDLKALSPAGLNLEGARVGPDAVLPEGWQRDNATGCLARIGSA